MRRVLLAFAFACFCLVPAWADTYVNTDSIAQASTFQQRVAYAVAVYAVQVVYVEAPTTPNHAKRAALAVAVLGGASIGSFATAVLAVPAIQDEASFAAGSPGYGIGDGDISNALGSTNAGCSSNCGNVWNAMAGGY